MPTPVQLVLGADLNNLQKFKDFINEQLIKAGFDESHAIKVELACDELLVNSISYAYQDKKGDITVQFNDNDSEFFEILIIDKGPPFNPLEAEAPDLDLDIDDRPVGGLGIFLVREMVDDLKYTRHDQCNILTLMVKK